MKHDDPFSDTEAPPSPAPEQDGDRESHGLSSPPSPAQDTPSSAFLLRKEHRLTPHQHMRVLAVAMVLVVFVALVGGYGIFRTVSQPPAQMPSAGQEHHSDAHLARGVRFIDCARLRDDDSPDSEEELLLPVARSGSLDPFTHQYVS